MATRMKLTWVVGIIAAASCTAVADIVDGGFENGLASWTADGTATVVTEGGNTLIGLVEPGLGSRSRIYQMVDAPTSPTWLSFRYRFVHAGTRPTGVPPESFTAYLTDDAGNRLVLQSGDDPTFSKAFSYVDSDGQMRFDASKISVTMLEDSDGLRTVTFDISGLRTPPGQIRVEFGLDGTGEGVFGSEQAAGGSCLKIG